MKNFLLFGSLIALFIGLSGCASPLETQAQQLCNQENVSAVYVCDDHVRVVSSLAGGGSSFYKLNARGELGSAASCPIVAPDAMSPECKQLLFEQACTERQIC